MTQKTLLLTGASRGIGHATVKVFQAAGWRVLTVSRTAFDARCPWHAGSTDHFQGDLSDASARQDLVERVRETLGESGLHAIVNNAGISPKHAGRAQKVWEMDPDEWRRVVDVNLTGSFNCIRALSPAMVAAGEGWIVNTSSVAGKTFFPIVASHYAATKSAIIGFTKHIAGELGPHGIRVNALAPGRIATPMVAGVAPELNEAEVARTPLGRLGEPAEVADTALWLTSPESSFVTGQTIDVAGGLCMT